MDRQSIVSHLVECARELAGYARSGHTQAACVCGQVALSVDGIVMLAQNQHVGSHRVLDSIAELRRLMRETSFARVARALKSKLSRWLSRLADCCQPREKESGPPRDRMVHFGTTDEVDQGLLRSLM